MRLCRKILLESRYSMIDPEVYFISGNPTDIRMRDVSRVRCYYFGLFKADLFPLE